VALTAQDATGAVVGWVQKNPELANTLVRMTVLVGGGSFALKGMLLATSTLTSAITLGGQAIRLTQAAWVGTRTVLLALPETLRAVQGGFYLVQAAIAAQGGLAPALKVLSASMLGPGAAVLAVGALAYALGTWADSAFGISDKLANAALWLLDGKDGNYAKTSNPSLTASGVQVYGDGTKVDAKTGQVIELGSGSPTLAPKSVRDARGAGAITLDQVNAAIASKKQAAAAPQGAPAGPAGTKPGAAPGQPQRGASDAARATREQTDVLDRGLRRIEQATREGVEETRRARRARGAGPGTPGTLGGF